ncbi:hypothetical protein [Halomonas llamarensis]|uniref:Uncharacterized protein n=1 Tax=Halomonas llamarensis TaxID=2945104 RepID=A0ABT0SLP9_9GAMM|nr:hypothetical protein [Halomonas llamarensis]MCL7928736.1 hypothetical protein [Halomonas llamarensis]
MASGFWHQIGLPARDRKLHELLHQGVEYRVYPRLAKVSGIEQKAHAHYVRGEPLHSHTLLYPVFGKRLVDLRPFAQHFGLKTARP